MRHPLTKALHQKALSSSRTHSHGVALTQRPGSVFYTTCHIYFGVTRSGTAPLTKLRQLVHAVSPRQRQNAVQHGRHVTGIQKKAVAVYPGAMLGIVVQEFRK